MALLISASVSVAAECAVDPDECTLKKLCEVATTVDGDNTTWSTESSSTKHVSTAQSLGMECGVTPIVDLCDTDPSECKLSQICGKATTESAGQVSWNDSAVAYVALAKEYGLQCDVVAKVAEVEEAPEKTVVKKTCSAKTPEACSTKVICQAATYTYGNSTRWIGEASKFSYVSEAKKRGLSCGVKTKTAVVSQSAELKKVFSGLSTLERKQMQYALKKLGYYQSTVDGVWGGKTKAALSSFIRSERIKPKHALFNLTEMVDVPSSFAAPKIAATQTRSFTEYVCKANKGYFKTAMFEISLNEGMTEGTVVFPDGTSKKINQKGIKKMVGNSGLWKPTFLKFRDNKVVFQNSLTTAMENGLTGSVHALERAEAQRAFELLTAPITFSIKNNVASWSQKLPRNSSSIKGFAMSITGILVHSFNLTTNQYVGEMKLIDYETSLTVKTWASCDVY